MARAELYIDASDGTTAAQVNNAAAGTRLILSGLGTDHALSTGTLKLPPYCILEGDGDGPDATRVTSSADLDVAGPIIVPSTGCCIRNVSSVGLSTSIYQAPFGFNGNAGVDQPTDFEIQDCIGIGVSDGFFFSINSISVLRFMLKRVKMRTQFDTCFLLGSDASLPGWSAYRSEVVLEDCDFIAQGPSVVGPEFLTARALCASGFNVRITRGYFEAGGNTDAASNNAALESDNAAGRTIVKASGATLYAHGTNAVTTHKINTQPGSPYGPGTILLGDCTGWRKFAGAA